jgi:capsular exopolysaccharide synthesis family protein
MVEHIQKALEKARQQRKAGQRQPISTASAESKVPTYAKTRVEPVTTQQLRERFILAGLNTDPAADHFRVLRAHVLKFLGKKSGKSLGVTSSSPGEGKSLVAANLAVSIALDLKFSVLLVDCDLRRPSLQSTFSLSRGPGLTDYLLDKAELHECLVNPGIEHLVLLPAGSSIGNSSEMLASPQMLELANELKDRYPNRIVVCDLPPLLASDDTLTFLPQLDGCLLVVEERKTRTSVLQHTLDMLSDVDVMGTVLNRCDVPSGYSYYYG